MNVNLPILMYHAVHPESSVISISPKLFQWQMSWLYEKGYHVIPLNMVVTCLRDATALPERSIVLTFDDGYACLYDHALPVLARYGFPATVFLVTGHCGRMNDWEGQPAIIPGLPILNWDQIIEMAQQGIEFGSHSMYHPRLDQVELKRVENEIRDSKWLIEDKLGHPVLSFAYPYGRFDNRVSSIVRNEFSVACGTRLGLVTPASDPYRLERVEVFYLLKSSFFSGLLQAWFPLYLNIRRHGRLLASRVLGREWN